MTAANPPVDWRTYRIRVGQSERVGDVYAPDLLTAFAIARTVFGTSDSLYCLADAATDFPRPLSCREADAMRLGCTYCNAAPGDLCRDSSPLRSPMKSPHAARMSAATREYDVGYVRPLSCDELADAQRRDATILRGAAAAQQRVIAENRPQWNDAEYFAADDLRILRPSTGEMAVVAEGSDGNGLPISVRIIQGDSAQDIFAMSRPVTCEEIEATVNEIEMDPRRVAVRLIELERGADLARAHLEAIERRMGVLR